MIELKTIKYIHLYICIYTSKINIAMNSELQLYKYKCIIYDTYICLL